MSKNKPQNKMIGKDQPALASGWQEGDDTNCAAPQASSPCTLWAQSSVSLMINKSA